VDREKLEQLKTALQEKATILYIVDHRNKSREIFSGTSGN
jgi:hypothetical protein